VDTMQVDIEKRQLLRVIKREPNAFISEWNRLLSWRNSNNNVDMTKIRMRLEQLEADGMVIKVSHRYLLKSI